MLVVVSASCVSCATVETEDPSSTTPALDTPAAGVEEGKEPIGDASQDDAIGAIAGGVGGGLAGAVLGGIVFGPWGFFLGGLAGSATAGYYGSQAPSDRPPWGS